VRTAYRMQAAGGATGTKMADRRRAAARRMRQIASTLHTRNKLSREEATQAIRQVIGELVGLVEKAAVQATAPGKRYPTLSTRRGCSPERLAGGPQPSCQKSRSSTTSPSASKRSSETPARSSVPPSFSRVCARHGTAA
jgi:hypothetical protein